MPSKRPTIPAAPSATKTPPPESLRECLAPLTAAAVQTSVLAYQWGLHHRQLMRAGGIMDLAGWIVEECKRLSEHEESAEQVARDVARQSAATPEVSA